MAYVEQLKNAFLDMIFGPYAYSQSIAGVMTFGHTSERQVTRRGAGNFGGTGPVAITDDYMGETGVLTYEGIAADRIVQALLNGSPPATHVVDDSKRNYPQYLACNVFDEDNTTPLVSKFVSYAKFENKPRNVGPDAKTINFQAKWAKEFKGKQIVVQIFAGNATPVTTLTLSSTAYQDPDDSMIALAVLRQTENSRTVTPLAKTTDYTETTGAITLLSGLTATEKAAVIFVKA